MNFFPFDLAGTQFLVFYGALCALALIVGWMLRSTARASKEPEGSIEDLDPYAVIGLAGGDRSVFAGAVASLAEQGRIDARGHAAEGDPQPVGGLHPIESEVLRHLPTGLDRAARAFAGTPHELDRELEERGCLLSQERVGELRKHLVWILLAVLTLGIARCAQGISQERPIGFLILEMVAFAMLFGLTVLRGAGRRVTAGARRALRDLRTRLAAQGTEDLSLAVGLLGPAVLLGGTLAPLEPALRRAQLAIAPHTSGCGAALGCGGVGGGDGAGGCGGGGGGGCGGCGGS